MSAPFENTDKLIKFRISFHRATNVRDLPPPSTFSDYPSKWNNRYSDNITTIEKK